MLCPETGSRSCVFSSNIVLLPHWQCTVLPMFRVDVQAPSDRPIRLSYQPPGEQEPRHTQHQAATPKHPGAQGRYGTDMGAPIPNQLPASVASAASAATHGVASAVQASGRAAGKLGRPWANALVARAPSGAGLYEDSVTARLADKSVLLICGYVSQLTQATLEVRGQSRGSGFLCQGHNTCLMPVAVT